MIDRTYPQQAQCAEFVDDFNEVVKSGATFDDASKEVGGFVPEALSELSNVVKDYTVNGKSYSGRETVLRATMDGVNDFKKLHGRMPTGDVIENALRTSLTAVSQEHRNKFGITASFDDATSSASGAPMQANRAQVAVYQSIVDAVPFAGYIPMGEGLQGKLIIAKHEAASTCGAYAAGDNMDGMNVGRPYMSSIRRVALTAGAGTFKYADSDAAGSPVYPTGVDVYVDGVPVGGTVINTSNSVAEAPLVGQVRIDTTNYVLSGKVTTLTGVVAATFTPALPAGATVEASAILNYEHATMKSKRPLVQAAAYTFDFRAHYMTGNYRITQEAKVQFNAEVRMDAGTEAMYQLRVQSGAERHVEAIRAMYAVGKGYVTSFNLDAANRQAQRSRADIWTDVLFAMTAADQSMVERTQGFGISVLYVGSKGKAEITALPPALFTPSGTPSRAGIYRIGKLYGMFDVYFDPTRTVKETADAIEILAIGRSDQVARNPMIFGDVAGATVMPLGTNNDQEEGYGYFQALATRVNPHQDSARGAAIIRIINFAA